MSRFDGMVVVVTGTSSGIGKAIAEDLRSRGAKVYGELPEGGRRRSAYASPRRAR